MTAWQWSHNPFHLSWILPCALHLPLFKAPSYPSHSVHLSKALSPPPYPLRVHHYPAPRASPPTSPSKTHSPPCLLTSLTFLSLPKLNIHLLLLDCLVAILSLLQVPSYTLPEAHTWPLPSWGCQPPPPPLLPLHRPLLHYVLHRTLEAPAVCLRAPQVLLLPLPALELHLPQPHHLGPNWVLPWSWRNCGCCSKGRSTRCR